MVIGYLEETKATIDETMSKLEKLKVYPSSGFLLPLPETGMWDHAIKNVYITDIDQFLTNITERQDFSLNMTIIEEEELKVYTLKWLEKLNLQFGNLAKDKFIKTGGYDKYSKHQEKEKVDKNMTTKDSLNCAAQEGTLR